MRLRIEFIDGTTEDRPWVDDAGVQDGVLWVLPERHSSRTERYPLHNVRKWETNR